MVIKLRDPGILENTSCCDLSSMELISCGTRLVSPLSKRDNCSVVTIGQTPVVRSLADTGDSQYRCVFISRSISSAQIFEEKYDCHDRHTSNV